MANVQSLLVSRHPTTRIRGVIRGSITSCRYCAALAFFSRVRPTTSRFCLDLFAALIDDISPFKRGNEFWAVQKTLQNHLLWQFTQRKNSLLCRVLFRQQNTTEIWQVEKSLHNPFSVCFPIIPLRIASIAPTINSAQSYFRLEGTIKNRRIEDHTHHGVLHTSYNSR